MSDTAGRRAHQALRIIRGINSRQIGMVYVACHTFHMGQIPLHLGSTL